jgi:hypothetical protein
MNRIASSVLLALLAVSAPCVAAAESVVVIRGSKSSVEHGLGESWGRDPVVVSGPSVKPQVPSPELPVATAPTPIVLVVVDARAFPRLAWQLIDPWKQRGIRVHGFPTRQTSRIVSHSGLARRQASQIRVHTGFEPTIASAPMGRFKLRR